MTIKEELFSRFLDDDYQEKQFTQEKRERKQNSLKTVKIQYANKSYNVLSFLMKGIESKLKNK